MRALTGPLVGWMLAALALVAGYAGWGWRGVVLGFTVVVFWLLLQFSRALRVLRVAGSAPKGRVPNAVMFNAKLHAGMRLMDVLKLTRSLGTVLPVDAHTDAGADEVYGWADEAHDQVRLAFGHGRLLHWALTRAGADEGAPAAQAQVL